MSIIGRSSDDEAGSGDTGAEPGTPQEIPWLTEYDRGHLTLYSSLLAAERAGQDWREAAARLLKLDVETDEAAAKAIWDAHVQRARWFWTRSDDRSPAIPDRSR